jgi:hypothetical protein
VALIAFRVPLDTVQIQSEPTGDEASMESVQSGISRSSPSSPTGVML